MTNDHRVYVYIIGLAAALAGLLFGIDIGVVSGALPFVKKAFHLTTGEQEMVVSSVLVGAVFGTLVSGYLSEHFGRRNAILTSALIFCIGGILSALSTSATMLIAVRLFLGLALGIASFTAPLYLSEMAPKHIRGRLISMYQLMITIGILVAFFSDTLFTPTENWRWMFGVTAIPAFAMFLIIALLPKSPRWLMLKNRRIHAVDVLKKVRHPDDVNPEVDEIEEGLKAQSGSVWRMVKSKMFLKVMLLGVLLQMIQQFSGMNAILYYAPTIFKMAGFGSHTEQMWATVLIGFINMVTTIFAIMYADKLGRRKILFIGLSFTIISMLILGALFHIGISQSLHLQITAIVFILLFIIGFAMSLGPIIWVLCAEIFPLKVRDVGVTCSTTSNWASNAIVGATFLTMLNGLGVGNTFLVYAVLGILSFIIIYFFVPETKTVSLEAIEHNLLNGKPLRYIGIGKKS